MAQSNKNSDKVRQFKKSYLDFNFIDVIKKHTNRFTIKIAICVLVAIVAVIGIFLYKRYSSYDDYKVINSIKIDGSTESKYLSYKDFVIKYSGDGISYIDDDGTVWNEAFQMKSPMVDICGDYIAVADKNSNDVYIYNQDGNQGKVTTNFPIVKVEVAEQGVIAVLSEDKDANYIEVYDRDGNKLVIHKTLLDENGYPLDFSISKDGDKMAVSYITVNNGSMSNRVVFYNFSNAGKNSTDKIVGEFDQYKEVIVPTVKFVTNDDVVAAGENILSLYGFKYKPSFREDVKIKEEIQKKITREERKNTNLMLIEGALLIEDHYEEICDELWYVYVEDSIRRKRLKYARGYEDSKVDQIFEAQLPKDLFMRHCDRVIDNSGQFEETKIQLNKIVEDL